MNMRTCLMLAAFLFVCEASFAISYTWTGPDGSYHATDRLDKVPKRYREIIRHDVKRFVAPSGIGYERDGDGNYRFFDHSSPAREKTRREPPPDMEGAPGSPVTARQLAEIKRRYLEWGKEPRPDVNSGKVRRIISGDTFELEDGRKVTFIGIEFPEELKGETKIHEEAKEFQRKLMKGKTVHFIFGPRDDKGRRLAYVYLGTDVFVNAELVMNGYARVNSSPGNKQYQKLFHRLEQFARKSMLGMWDPGGE